MLLLSHGKEQLRKKNFQVKTVSPTNLYFFCKVAFTQAKKVIDIVTVAAK
jgi:hypothetical protein